MRKNISILKFLLLCILFFIINSCSKDNASISCNTFLECQEGTVWFDNNSYTDEITYIRFINNSNTILEIFNKFLPAKRNCFNNYFINRSWGEINIVENTENTLIFLILPTDWELNTVEFTFIRTVETLNLTFCIYDEGGILLETTESILIKSNADVDDLPICNLD